MSTLDGKKYIKGTLKANTIRDKDGRCWKISGLTTESELDPGVVVTDLSQAGIDESLPCCEECEWTEEDEVAFKTSSSSSKSSSSIVESSESSSSSSSEPPPPYYYGYYGYYGPPEEKCPPDCIDILLPPPIGPPKNIALLSCILACQFKYGEASCDPAGYLVDNVGLYDCHCCYKGSSSSSSSLSSLSIISASSESSLSVSSASSPSSPSSLSVSSASSPSSESSLSVSSTSSTSSLSVSSASSPSSESSPSSASSLSSPSSSSSTPPPDGTCLWTVESIFDCVTNEFEEPTNVQLVDCRTKCKDAELSWHYLYQLSDTECVYSMEWCTATECYTEGSWKVCQDNKPATPAKPAISPEDCPCYTSSSSSSSLSVSSASSPSSPSSASSLSSPSSASSPSSSSSSSSSSSKPMDTPVVCTGQECVDKGCGSGYDTGDKGDCSVLDIQTRCTARCNSGYPVVGWCSGCYNFCIPGEYGGLYCCCEVQY